MWFVSVWFVLLFHLNCLASPHRLAFWILLRFPDSSLIYQPHTILTNMLNLSNQPSLHLYYISCCDIINSMKSNSFQKRWVVMYILHICYKKRSWFTWKRCRFVCSSPNLEQEEQTILFSEPVKSNSEGLVLVFKVDFFLSFLFCDCRRSWVKFWHFFLSMCNMVK